MNAISELHKKIDALDAALAKESASRGRPITCEGKGCCACCKEPVYCSSAEVKHMLELLCDGAKDRVAARTSTAIEKVKATGLFDKDMPPVMEWLAMKLPCPFLYHDQCSVYANRPISCRSHMAVGPKEWCETNRMEQKYPMADEHSMACGQAIIEAHAKLGGEIVHDNLLALLEGELLGEYHPTASAQKIILETDQQSTKGQI